MPEPDPRGLVVFLEPEPTLALLPAWSLEVPTISALGRSYGGIVIDDPIFFDWRIARDGSVLGVTFFPPRGLPDELGRGLRSTLAALAYVDDAGGMPTAWFSGRRGEGEDPGAVVSQDFAAAIYAAGTDSWALALNIDWLSMPQRDRLAGTSARWVDARCEVVRPGVGTSLRGRLPAEGLYGLRSWFGSSEGHR